jgi:hypothetical protein
MPWMVILSIVPMTLRQCGFRNAIKRFMKTERSRLKARYMGGDTTYPIHLDPRQWDRLQKTQFSLK